MRRFTLPLLLLALLPLVSSCGSSGGGTPGPTPTPSPIPSASRTVTITVEWSARGRVTPSSALSTQVTIAGGGTDGTDVVFHCNRSSTTAAHTEPYESNRQVRFGTFPLTLRFFSGANATGTEVATANSTLTNDAAGTTGGAVTLTQKIATVEVAANQSFPVGSDTSVSVTCRDSASNVVAVTEGSAILEVTDGSDKGQIVAGRLRGIAAGQIRLRATVDGLTSPTAAATVGSSAFNVAVTGTRGSIPLTINTTAQLAVPGSPLSFTGMNPLSALASYGDRNFVAWRRQGADISSNPTLSTLPGDLVSGETLTAVYGPAGTRVGRMTPHYNQDDPAYWPSDHLIKVFFDSAISADQKTVMMEGFNRWSNALGKTLYSVVTSAGEANVLVGLGTLSGEAATTAITTSSLTAPRPIVSGAITFDPAKVPSASTTNERPVFVALASHEFGHLLGIRSATNQGHSSDPLDTMFATVSEGTKFITLRDMNTIQNLYFSADGTFDGRKRPVPSRAAGTYTEAIPCRVTLRYR